MCAADMQVEGDNGRNLAGGSVQLTPRPRSEHVSLASCNIHLIYDLLEKGKEMNLEIKTSGSAGHRTMVGSPGGEEGSRAHPLPAYC